jgi:hypothetical protein
VFACKGRFDPMKCASNYYLEQDCLGQAETHRQADRDRRMIKRSRNWLLVTVSAALLTACGQDLPPAIDTPLVAPAPDKALKGAYQAVSEEKLTGFIEVSEVREGKSLGPGEYLLCLRGAPSPFTPRRTYAVFFDNDEYKGVRLSVILDECEKQAFSPLPPKPPSKDDKDEPESKSGHEDHAASVNSR